MTAGTGKSAATVVSIDGAAVDEAAIASALICGEKGAIKACEHNARQLLAVAPDYAELHYDEFLDRFRIGRRDWTDHDDREALLRLQSEHEVPAFTIGQVQRAVKALGYSRRRDSLRDFVVGLEPWDGVPRITFAFANAWGAEDDPSNGSAVLNGIASRNFFIALVARAMKPGAQVDTLWVFEGDQGTRKSQSLRTLGGDLHAEITAPIGTADFLRELRGLWIAELSELDSLRGREASTIKRLLSTPRDRFVEKYETHPRAYPRRAVAVATTNECTYWQDSTGARRLIPVRVGNIQLDLIERERLQWFAEAKHLFDEGATWWEFPDTMADAQDDRQQVDPWEDLLRDAIASGRPSGVGMVAWPIGWISSAAIMRDWLHLEPHQQGQASSTRLGHVMRRLGFIPQRFGKGRERGWAPVADTCAAQKSEESA